MLAAFFSNQRLKAYRVFLLFSVLSISLRFFSFFPSVIDHDESTYLEIARQLLAGKVLYVDYIDIKPPGIFLILAGFQAIFGYSIFIIRLLIALWIALTALLIYKTSRHLVHNERASLASGIIYIFFVSTWSYYGISTTPEIFFNLFTITALYVLLTIEGRIKFFLSGLIAGMGFIIKYFVLFDFTAFMVFFVLLNSKNSPKGNHVKNLFTSLVLAGTGFSSPFILVNLHFYLTGHFMAFFNITYMAPFRYPEEFNLIMMLKFLMEFHLLFLPLLFFFYYSLFDKEIVNVYLGEIKKLIMIWAGFVLIAVILSGNPFGHYTIQMMLPVSLMTGIFFHSDRKLPGFLKQITTGKPALIILVALLLFISLMKLEYIIREDQPREVAAYLKPKLNTDDIIFTGNYHHILYYLLKKDSPTPYLHRSLLTEEGHLEALGIDANAEFSNIINQRPEYIIIENEYPAKVMQEFITGNYALEKDFGRGVLLYKMEGD